MKSFAQVVLTVAALLVETGCAQGDIRAGKTLYHLFSRNSAVENTPLSPDLRYLRLAVDGRVALLVLGYVTPDAGGDIEVWYSAYGEVLKLRRGRIVGTAGLATDWRSVRLDRTPLWSSLSHGSTTIVREHDEMPGYRIGIRETLAVSAIDAPAASEYVGNPEQLRWFEERSDSFDWAPSRYAIDISPTGREVPVYGEQCISKKLCLVWQRWPATK